MNWLRPSSCFNIADSRGASADNSTLITQSSSVNTCPKRIGRTVAPRSACSTA